MLKRKDAAYVKRSNRFREHNKQERKTKQKARLIDIASQRPNNPQKTYPHSCTRGGCTTVHGTMPIFGAVGWLGW